MPHEVEVSRELVKCYKQLGDLAYELDKVAGDVQYLALKISGEEVYPQPSKTDDASSGSTTT